MTRSQRRLLRDLRAMLDEERAGVIGYSCYGDVVAKFEETGELPPASAIDPKGPGGMRRLYRRQCRLIERIDEALAAQA